MAQAHSASTTAAPEAMVPHATNGLLVQLPTLRPEPLEQAMVQDGVKAHIEEITPKAKKR